MSLTHSKHTHHRQLPATLHAGWILRVQVLAASKLCSGEGRSRVQRCSPVRRGRTWREGQVSTSARRAPTGKSVAAVYSSASVGGAIYGISASTAASQLAESFPGCSACWPPALGSSIWLPLRQYLVRCWLANGSSSILTSYREPAAARRRCTSSSESTPRALEPP